MDVKEQEGIMALYYGRAVVTADALKIRTGPGLQYTAIAQVPRNQTVDVYGFSGDNKWAYIQWNGYWGWVSTAYLIFLK